MTAPRTRNRVSLGIAVALHLALFMILAMTVIPQLEAGSSSEGVGLEEISGNADYDEATALSLPSLPTPPDLPSLPEHESLTVTPTLSEKPVSAPVAKQMQVQAGGTADGDIFLARVRAHLAHYRQALPAALSAVRGTTLLRFTVGDDGAVHDVSVATSSGNAALDQQATALLLRAQPLPHKPAAVTLVVPVEFGAKVIRQAN